jgi:uncharacterized protein (DUF1919 family)
MKRWETSKEELALHHEAAVILAKKNHEKNVRQAEEEWQERKKEIDAVNEMRLAEAQKRHERLIEEVRELNIKNKSDYDERVKAIKVCS